MSKVFLASSGRQGRVIRILEATPDVAKETVIRVKAKDPHTSIALFGAKDIDTLKRTQPSLAVAKVTKSVDDFIGQITGTVAHVVQGGEIKKRALVGSHRRDRTRGYRGKATEKGIYVQAKEKGIRVNILETKR